MATLLGCLSDPGHVPTLAFAFKLWILAEPIFKNRTAGVVFSKVGAGQTLGYHLGRPTHTLKAMFPNSLEPGLTLDRPAQPEGIEGAIRGRAVLDLFRDVSHTFKPHGPYGLKRA